MRRERLLGPVLVLGGILVSLSQVVVVPLLPDLPRLTGASAASVSWLVTVTLLVGAICTPLLGRAGDMYGKKKVLLLALAMLTSGSALCAVTSDIALLILARGLQGVALAVVPLSISILRDAVPPARMGASVAMISSAVGVGAAAGVPFGALITEVFNWHGMFWVSASLGLVDLLLAWLVVRESPNRSSGRFDVLGAVGLAGGLLCLLLPLTKGADWGWASRATIGLFAGGVTLLGLWGWWQLRASTPLVDLRLARKPAVLLPNIATLFIGYAFYSNSLSTAQLVQVPTESGYGLGVSVVVAGLCLLPGGLAIVLLSPVSARISAVYGPRTTLMVGSAVIAAGYGVRLFTSHSITPIVLGATVVACGTALAYSALPVMIMQAVPVSKTAAANGLNVLLRTLGQAICSAVVAVVLGHVTLTVRDGGTGAAVTVPSLDAFLIVFGISGAVALLALCVVLRLPRTGPRAVPVAVPPAVPAAPDERAQAGRVAVVLPIGRDPAGRAAHLLGEDIGVEDGLAEPATTVPVPKPRARTATR